MVFGCLGPPAATPKPSAAPTAAATPVATAAPTPVATAAPTPVATAAPTPVVTAQPQVVHVGFGYAGGTDPVYGFIADYALDSTSTAVSTIAVKAGSGMMAKMVVQ